jgi:hypothetical protein
MEKTEQSVTSSAVDNEAHTDTQLDKKIRWKRDVVLIPILGLMYLVSGILHDPVPRDR